MNTSTEKENEQLELWRKENPELFEVLVREWKAESLQQLSILNSDDVKEKLWRKFTKEKNTSSLRFRSYPRIILKYAAILIIFVSVVFVIKRYINHETLEKPVYERIVKSNPAGQKTLIKLPDGTAVNLNAESEISFYNSFSDTARIVHLSGEAFFNIKRDTLRPFFVYVDKVKIKALGTSFNVKELEESDNLSVSLSTGKVQVDHIEYNKVIELKPGEQITYNKLSGQFSEVINYDRVEVESWKNGNLYFKKSNLNTIVRELEKWYGVKISLGPLPENTVSYTGIFRNQNLENVLTSMGFALSFDYKIENKNVLINFKNK